MSDELITKKELLDITGISYGQLYRWKRKGIIPEQWFIKKSSFTGQETYFEKDKILERINKIMELKDTVSLDEIADMFSMNPVSKAFTKDYLIDKGLVTEGFLNLYIKSFGDKESFKVKDIICIYLFKTILKKNILSFNKAEEVIKEVYENYDNIENKDYNLLILQNIDDNSSISVLAEKNSFYLLNKDFKEILNININNAISKLRKEIM